MVTSVRAVYEHGQLRLLDPVELEDGEQVSVTILREERAGLQPGSRLSARDLLKLPIEERNRLMVMAATRAEEDYHTDSNLIDFEAFWKHDLYDETP